MGLLDKFFNGVKIMFEDPVDEKIENKNESEEIKEEKKDNEENQSGNSKKDYGKEKGDKEENKGNTSLDIRNMIKETEGQDKKYKEKFMRLNESLNKNKIKYNTLKGGEYSAFHVQIVGKVGLVFTPHFIYQPDSRYFLYHSKVDSIDNISQRLELANSKFKDENMVKEFKQFQKAYINAVDLRRNVE